MTAEEEVRAVLPSAYVDYIKPPQGNEWLYQIRLHTGEALSIVSLTMDYAWEDALSRLTAQRDELKKGLQAKERQ